MPYSVRGQPPPPSRYHKSIHLRVRVYSSRKGAVYDTVHTQIVPKRRGPGAHANSATRYPWVEPLFRDRHIQPFVHESRVKFIQQGRQHNYLIFCQNHLHLPLNSSLQDRWRGDIVVMRVAQNPDIGIVNARGEDTALINEMINQFLQRYQQKQRFRLPKQIKIVV